MVSLPFTSANPILTQDPDFVINVPADVLEPNNAKASAGTVLTINFMFSMKFVWLSGWFRNTFWRDVIQNGQRYLQKSCSTSSVKGSSSPINQSLRCTLGLFAWAQHFRPDCILAEHPPVSYIWGENGKNWLNQLKYYCIIKVNLMWYKQIVIYFGK